MDIVSGSCAVSPYVMPGFLSGWVSHGRVCDGAQYVAAEASLIPSTLRQVTTLMGAIDEAEKRPQLTDEQFETLRERVKEQGAVVKASKEACPRNNKRNMHSLWLREPLRGS